MPHSYDVIVIGAGLAGLAATAQLTREGRTVALIEARPRLGGRVWTHHEPALDHAIELGPEWFDATGPMHELLTARDALSVEADGDHWRRVGSELRNISDDADGGDALHHRLAGLHGLDRSLASALAECAGPDDRGAIEMLLHYVEGFHAADPSELSLDWFRTVEQNQPAGAAELRAPGGLHVAVDVLARTIGRTATVFLDTTVTRIAWRPGHVAVDCATRRTTGTLHARAAIVALPLGVLAAPPGETGAVTFSPGLGDKMRVFELLATGPVVKLSLRFDEPFWFDRPRLTDTLFVQDFSQPIPTWWTSRPARTPLLVGWAAGPQVARIDAADQVAMRHLAIRSLAHALQMSPNQIATRLRQLYWHDWQRDPYAWGAYSWVRTGGLDAHRLLALPLADTLFFAGEATAGSGFNATMDGAIESGWRAAAEVLALN